MVYKRIGSRIFYFKDEKEMKAFLKKQNAPTSKKDGGEK